MWLQCASKVRQEEDDGTPFTRKHDGQCQNKQFLQMFYEECMFHLRDTRYTFAWDRSRHSNICQTRSSPALLQTLTVALHYVGNDAVGPVALPGVHLSALRAGACASLDGTPGTGPVTLNAALAEGVVTGQGHRLLEEIQADGADSVYGKDGGEDLIQLCMREHVVHLQV